MERSYTVSEGCGGKEFPRIIAPTELKDLLRYDKETGDLFWLTRPERAFNSPHAARAWNAKFANKKALTARSARGYRRGTIQYQSYSAHRVIWALVHGEWPQGVVDHINGDTSDNRLENLRIVSQAENCLNCKRQANNTTGVTGVSVFRNRYQAKIKIGGKHIHIGIYQNFEDAVAARKAAEKQYGFHPNHDRT